MILDISSVGRVERLNDLSAKKFMRYSLKNIIQYLKNFYLIISSDSKNS